METSPLLLVLGWWQKSQFSKTSANKTTNISWPSGLSGWTDRQQSFNCYFQSLWHKSVLGLLHSVCMCVKFINVLNFILHILGIKSRWIIFEVLSIVICPPCNSCLWKWAPLQIFKSATDLNSNTIFSILALTCWQHEEYHTHPNIHASAWDHIYTPELHTCLYCLNKKLRIRPIVYLLKNYL